MRKSNVQLLLPVEGVVPVLEVILADEALHLLHFAHIRQDDQHGGVALVGQHDDGGVVFGVVVEVVAASPLHHVNLYLGLLVHSELGLAREVAVEGFLPLSCRGTNDTVTAAHDLLHNFYFTHLCRFMSPSFLNGVTMHSVCIYRV